MAKESEYQALLDRISALQNTVSDQHAADLIANPQLADALMGKIDDMLAAVVAADEKTPPPPDQGLGQLAGVGPEAATKFGDTRIPQGVEPYDEQVQSERIVAIGDLYYIYQHEKIGVFRVIHKLKELFQAGAVRLSGGPRRLSALSIRSSRCLAVHPSGSLGRLPTCIWLRKYTRTIWDHSQRRLPSYAEPLH
jgi:hypothetical protein